MKLMADGADGPASNGQEGWNVSMNSQILVLHVRHQLRLRVVAWLGTDCLAPCFWVTTCGNHRGTISAHCQMSLDFKLMPVDGYEACLEGLLSCQVPRTP